jgi:heme-binding NEAT domain protein
MTMMMIYQIYIPVNIIRFNSLIKIRLDFRRLRASDLKSATTTNDDQNTSGTKRKAQTSQVNNEVFLEQRRKWFYI